jgi:hypothetical protein
MFIHTVANLEAPQSDYRLLRSGFATVQSRFIAGRDLKRGLSLQEEPIRLPRQVIFGF